VAEFAAEDLLLHDVVIVTETAIDLLVVIVTETEIEKDHLAVDLLVTAHRETNHQEIETDLLAIDLPETNHLVLLPPLQLHEVDLIALSVTVLQEIIITLIILDLIREPEVHLPYLKMEIRDRR